MRVTVICPVWKRAALTRLVLAYWATWDVPGVEFAFRIVRSPGDLAKDVLPDDERFHATWSRNQPLGMKFNAGIQAATATKPDYVMVMGSDVLVHDSIFADYLPLMKAGKPFIGVYDTYLYDVPTAKAYYWSGYRGKREGEVIGPGRLYSKILLDRKGWRIYPDDLNRNLDGSVDADLPKPAGIWSRDHKMCSLKTEGSITPTRNYREAVEVPTAELYFKGADFTTL